VKRIIYTQVALTPDQFFFKQGGFKNSLIKNNLYDKLFCAINKQLKSKGIDSILTVSGNRTFTEGDLKEDAE